MQEKLNLCNDQHLLDISDYQSILNEFSRKQNQSLEAFRSQFDFIDDDSVLIKEKSSHEHVLSMIQLANDSESSNKIKSVQMVQNANSEETDFDGLETINLESGNKPNSFWYRSDTAKIETKFDNFIPSNTEDIDHNDDFLKILGDKINKYEPSDTINSIKTNTCYESRENIKKSQLDTNILSISAESETTETAEDQSIIDSSHLPGEILDFENEQSEINEKPFHLTKLNISQQKSPIEIDLSKTEIKKNDNDQNVDENLVEVFELDKFHDYDTYIYKSRFDLSELNLMKTYSQ